MEQFLAIFKYFPQFDNSLTAGLLMFARILAFAKFAPVLGRSEINPTIRVAFSLILTIILFSVTDVGTMPKDFPFILGILINVILGAFTGWVASAIFSAIAAGGDMINMQMGLSSAMMFDQSTKSQGSLLSSFFNLLAAVLYINIGGLYWLIIALKKTFDICGIFITSFSLANIASPEYLISITANVLYVGLQIASPILLASLGQDIILGIISRTAPQVNVFQLSFLFKPGLGALILIFILPMLINVMNDYFISFQGIIN